jgi:hypothetical protein
MVLFISATSLELLLVLEQVQEPVPQQAQEQVQEPVPQQVQEPLALLPFCSRLQR